MRVWLGIIAVPVVAAIFAAPESMGRIVGTAVFFGISFGISGLFGLYVLADNVARWLS
ncbi:MAG: hypothetical protein QOF13_2131 [Solirubrobacterales bacterium]|jgi:hypothetical protein|nr:hypothetical protein [Solirubrobacterales bacterium]